MQPPSGRPRLFSFTITILLIVAFILLPSSHAASTRLHSLLRRNQTPNLPLLSPFDSLPHMPLTRYHAEGRLPGDDAFSQIRALIGPDEEIVLNAVAAAKEANEMEGEDEATSFVEVGTSVSASASTSATVGRVHSFCEICILIMQMKERGQPHLCAGLNSNYYITCIETLESLLRADKALVYWLKNGCMHMDSEGPEIVRPCPAINICSWVPNLFADAPSLVRDGVESLCPKDPKFLPTIPLEFRNLLGATDNTANGPNGPNQPTTNGL